MAVLQKIRDRNVLLVSIIALALILFILSMSNKSCSGASATTAGEIAGEELSIEDYQKMVSNFQYMNDLTNPNAQNSEEMTNRIHDQAWQSYIVSKLVEKECEKVGLAVTDEEVEKVVTTDGMVGNQLSSYLRIFANPETMEYDANQFITLSNNLQELRDGGRMAEDQEKLYNFIVFAKEQIKNELLLSKYNTLMINGFISNPIEAKMNFNQRTAGKDILLVGIPYTSVSDSTINITDEEIAKRFETDKAKYAVLSEVRDAKVIDVVVTPSDKDKKDIELEFNSYYSELDSASTEKEIAQVVRNSGSDMPYSKMMKSENAFPTYIKSLLDGTDTLQLSVGQTSKPRYDQLSNKYYTVKLVGKETLPDSVLQRRLLISGKDNKDRSARVDSVLKALNSNGGKNFSDIAKTYNQNGDSMWISTSSFERSRMDNVDDQNFINSLFTSGTGIHQLQLQSGDILVYQIIATKSPITKYDVAVIEKTFSFSEDTYKEAFNKISSFLATNKTIAEIEANAEKSGYSVQSMSLTSNQHHIGQVSHTNDAIKWLFDEAEIGETSKEIYRCGNNDHFMIVTLTGVSEGTSSESVIKEGIKQELMNEKKAEIIMKSIGNNVEKAKNYSNAGTDTLTNVTYNIPTMVPSTHSRELLVSTITSKTAVGKTSKAFAGTNGVYMLTVLKNSEKEAKDVYEEKAEKEQMSQQNVGQAMNTMLYSLMKKYNVKDSRYKFNM